jgi:predicted MFS family arabinose efflux permease
MQKEGFLLCGVAIAGTLILALLFVREEEQTAAPGHRFRAAIQELIDAARTPAVATAAAFLFLWSFNPFSTAVLYLYMTGPLGISEQTYGFTVSMLSIGAIAGSLAYGAYCRRVSTRTLIHVAIAAGVLSTLAYMAIQGPTSAALISVLVGFTYLTGSMVQFDLAAQACPIHVAGTTFALLMSVSNLSLSLSAALGGWIYDRWSAQWGEAAAFRWLVLLGAASTCLCWLLVPLILRTIKPAETTISELP